MNDIAGTYEDTQMKCCKVNISACNNDMGCVCFMCGPIPFSGTPICKAGENVWANFQVRQVSCTAFFPSPVADGS